MVAGGRGAWNAAVERVVGIDARRKRVSAPDQRLCWIEGEADVWTTPRQDVKDQLKVTAPPDEGAVVQKKDVKKEVGAFVLDAEKEGMKDKGEEEGSERIALLSAGG